MIKEDVQKILDDHKGNIESVFISGGMIMNFNKIYIKSLQISNGHIFENLAINLNETRIFSINIEDIKELRYSEVDKFLSIQSKY